MQAIILAAGLGKRLRPLTERYSKAMLPLLGRPMVQWVLDTLLPNSIEEVIFIFAPEDRLIREFFGEELPGGIRCRWLRQNERLGMAHALSLTRSLIRGPFILSACDSLISAEFVQKMLAEDADAVLALEDVAADRVCRSASVRIEDGRILAIIEKPRPGEAFSSTVSLPLYRLPLEAAEIACHVPRSKRGEYEIQDVIQALVDQGSTVRGVKTRERLQISSPGDYLELSFLLLDRLRPPLPAELSPGLRLNPPILIDKSLHSGKGCEIGPHVVIGRNCSLGEGVHLKQSVLLPGTRIRDGAHVKGCIAFFDGNSTRFFRPTA